jgi:DNA polymerase elongation subunit (family B)
LEVQAFSSGADLSRRLAELTAPASEVGESLLASATYDGDLRVAVLKFYDQKAGRFWLWRDNTGHRPYCYTRLPLSDLGDIRSRKDVVEIVDEEKNDLLNDKKAILRKIVTTDPLAVGGGNDSIRDRVKVWEGDIKYYENYTYDRGLRMGTYYRVSGGKPVPVGYDVPEKVSHSLEAVMKSNPPEFAPYLKEWAELLGEPLCDFKRVALDIEVANEAGRLPDPEDPKQPVIAVSFFGAGEKLVYLLRGDKAASGLAGKPFDYVVFDDEASLLRATMGKVMDYPVVVTFNGDDFDLRYLKHRADALGIGEGEDPIQLERVAASLKHGVHIDLYQFFRNKSIQVYAFSNKYTDHTLNGISEALLNKSKIEFEGEVGDLPLEELAEYCLNDAQLTYELTSMGGDVVMKLLLVISRIGKMPINDVSRLGVSNWIRSMLFYEHRRMGALIPRQDELAEKGGATSQAVIKGKKYKGGLVIEPKPGVFFDVSVLDFASLVYDESIFVRKRQTGQVYEYKIGDFVDKHLPANDLFSAKEIGPTWDVLSFDYEEQQASWKTVTAVIRHPRQSDVLQITTEAGRKVTVTKGHSLITLDSTGEKRTIKGSDLKTGDFLVTLSSFPTEQHDESLDLLPYLERIPGFEITRGGGGNGKKVILRSERSHRRFVLERFLPLSAELMWGLGYWMAEGWIAKHSYGDTLRIEATTSDIEVARSKFSAAGFNTWMSRSRTPGCSNLGIGGRYAGEVNVLPNRVVAALVKIWFGNAARTKKVPDWVLRLPLTMRRAFVDGYYKGDGYNEGAHGQFVVNGKYKIGSYSQLLVNGMMSLGLMTGFHCISKDIETKESYLTWGDGSETYRNAKRPPPELLVRSVHVRSFSSTPYYGTHHGTPRYERVRRLSVEGYLPEFQRFYNGNCHFEKVTRIEEIENGRPVYDISVRGSESFFTGDGILVSNSLYPSLIKIHNLSYETVNCVHPECRSNTIPDTSSWVCKRRKGITSLVTGSLRDLRVNHYKPLTRDTTLSKTDKELYNVVTQGLKVILNACFTGDTYIVAPEGIRNIKDFKVGDRVVNVNPDTMEVEIDEVVEVQAFEYAGKMYHFKNDRNLDLLVTPNHRMLTVDLQKSSKTGTVFRTAEEVYNLTNMRIPSLRSPLQSSSPPRTVSLLGTAKELGAEFHLYSKGEPLIDLFRRLEPELRAKVRANAKVCKNRSKKDDLLRSHYSLPSTDITEADIDEVERAGGLAMVAMRKSTRIPVRFDPIDFAELCGWFVSEGSPYNTFSKTYESGHVRGDSSGITITQGYGRENKSGVLFRSDIHKLLRRLRIPYSADSSDGDYVKVASRILHKWILENCYAQVETGHKAQQKKIPGFVFSNKDTMRAFLNAAYMGDGASRQTLFSTTSKWLAEEMIVLLTLLGSKTKVKWDDGVFRLTFSNRTTKLTGSAVEKHRCVEKLDFDGKVYCITTAKNHTVFAGREGGFVPVGQSYGVMGFETFSFYCLPVAEATAALGRYSITKTIEKCQELGINVLYSDTDSLFLQNPSMEQIGTISRWSNQELGVELDLDKAYRYVAFSSRKKNYFGVLPDGTVDVRGMTGKKSQTPEYLKTTFYSTVDILSKVKTPDDFERAKKNIRELLTKMISDLKGKKVPVEQLAFNVIMGKDAGRYNGTTPQHVRAAKLLEEKGKEVKAGEIIQYVKTKSPPYVKPVELARVEDVDADKYIEYAQSMFDQMLDALDFSFEEIMGATTLDFFWSR